MGNYSYNNYLFIRAIINSRKPDGHYVFYEHDDGDLYFSQEIVAGDPRLYTTKDEGQSITELSSHGTSHNAYYPDRINDRLYFIYYDSALTSTTVKYVDLSDDSVNDVRTFGSRIGWDLWLNGTDIWIIRSIPTDNVVVLSKWDGLAQTDYSQAIAGVGDPTTNSFVVVIGNLVYFLADDDTNGYIELWSFNMTTGVFTDLDHTFAGSDLPSNRNLRGIAYDDSDILTFILYDIGDSKYYECTYVISTDTFTKKGERNIALMLNRMTNSGNAPPFNLEKGYHVSLNEIYQISRARGNLHLISTYNFMDTVQAITDTYLIDASGNLYKFQDVIALNYITILEVTHEIEDYSEAKIQYRSDKLSISEGQFIQLIGIHSENGASNSNSVVFEGIAERPDKEKHRNVLVVNEGIEMDEVKPSGSKSGRSDQIISDVNDDGEIDYISDGTLSNGAAMGTVVLGGDKSWRRIMNQFRDIDEFLWYLKPQGEFYYDDGTVDTGINLEFEAGVDTDKIDDVHAFEITGINKVIVYGAIVDGVQTEGSADDLADQQANGIKKMVIRDALLNTNALCNTKAAALLSRDLDSVTVVRFKFRKTTVGYIQVGQTITFKYISTNISISSGQFIVERFVLDALSDENYVQITSALNFDYGELNEILPEENSQLINQLGASLAAHDLDAAFDLGKEIDGATSDVNSMNVGDGTYKVELFSDGFNPNIKFSGAQGKVTNVIDPTAAQDVATKNYADGLVEDDVLDSGWNGDTSHAPSQNAVYDWTVAEHVDTLELHPIPLDEVTSGANKVYWDSGGIQHGTTSKTNSRYARINKILPSNFVDGEDVVFRIVMRSPTANDEIDYRLISYYATDAGSGYTIITDEDSTFNASATAGGEHTEEFTISGTNLKANYILQLLFYMEDNNNVNTLSLKEYELDVTVNTKR